MYRVIKQTALCEMVYQLNFPHPHYRQPVPHGGWQHYLHSLEINYSVVKLPIPILKSKGKILWLMNHQIKSNFFKTRRAK